VSSASPCRSAHSSGRGTTTMVGRSSILSVVEVPSDHPILTSVLERKVSETGKPPPGGGLSPRRTPSDRRRPRSAEKSRSERVRRSHSSRVSLPHSIRRDPMGGVCSVVEAGDALAPDGAPSRGGPSAMAATSAIATGTAASVGHVRRRPTGHGPAWSTSAPSRTGTRSRVTERSWASKADRRRSTAPQSRQPARWRSSAGVGSPPSPIRRSATWLRWRQVIGRRSTPDRAAAGSGRSGSARSRS